MNGVPVPIAILPHGDDVMRACLCHGRGRRLRPRRRPARRRSAPPRARRADARRDGHRAGAAGRLRGAGATAIRPRPALWRHSPQRTRHDRCRLSRRGVRPPRQSRGRDGRHRARHAHRATGRRPGQPRRVSSSAARSARRRGTPAGSGRRASGPAKTSAAPERRCPPPLPFWREGAPYRWPGSRSTRGGGSR